MSSPGSWDPPQFEADRLEMFANHGLHARSRWIDDGNGRTTYLVEGGSGSPTRVLVHGGLSEAASWALLAGRLHGRLAILDRPGYGLSSQIDYRRAGDFFLAAGSWLDSVIRGLGGASVDLVGTSMGGFFAAAYALQHPERVRRLVLVASPAGIERHVPLFLRLFANPIVGRLLMRATYEDPEQLRRRAYGALSVHPDRVPADQLDVEFTASRMPAFGLTTYSMLRSVLGIRGWRPRYLIGDRLLTLRTPTLMVWGDQDTSASLPSVGRAIASEMPLGRFELVPDAGHAPWIDQPDSVAELVNSFLD